MTTDQKTAALKELVSLLESSSDAIFSESTVQDLLREVNAASESMDSTRINWLIAPTGDLQETSIDNGWEDAFLRLASILEA